MVKRLVGRNLDDVRRQPVNRGVPLALLDGVADGADGFDLIALPIG